MKKSLRTFISLGFVGVCGFYSTYISNDTNTKVIAQKPLVEQVKTVVKEKKAEPIVEKISTKTPVNKLVKIEINNNKKQVHVLEKISDFSPSLINSSEKISQGKPEPASEEIKFVRADKTDVKITKVQEKNVNIVKEEKRNEIVDIEIESFDGELSYREIEDQGAVNIQKIEPVKISDFKIEIIDYSKVEFIAEFKETPKKKELKIDRISTVASSNKKQPKEKSPINNKNSDEKLKPSDELVFFDYNEDGKVKMIEQAVSETKQETSLKTFDLEESPSIEEVGISVGISRVEKEKSKPLVLPKLQTVNTQVAAVDKNIKQKNKSNESSKSRLLKKNLKNIVDNASKITKRESFDDQKKSASDYSNPEVRKAIASLLEDKNDYSCLDEKSEIGKVNESVYEYSLDSINYRSKEYEKVHNFEVRYADDQDDIAQDYGSGVIDQRIVHTGNLNIRRARFLTSGHYPIVTDLVFEGLDSKISIPTFELDSWDEIIRNNNLRGGGAQLLVELDQKTEDVELDENTKYQAKLYLNENLRVINRAESDYNYVLFVGADSGNTIVYFKLSNNKITNKIVHITEDEMYYEPNFYAEIKKDSVSFYKETLLSKCKSILPITSGSMKTWSYDGKIKKDTLNEFSINKMIYPVGTRKYMELNHLEESIFVGRWGKSNIVIPDENYINHVLGQFNVTGNECLVQINLEKNVKGFSLGAESYSGYMKTQEKFLDNDGNFYGDISGDTKKIFLMGEEQGIFNIKLEYTDGSIQTLQTFCSDNTYLVEQL